MLITVEGIKFVVTELIDGRYYVSAVTGETVYEYQLDLAAKQYAAIKIKELKSLECFDWPKCTGAVFKIV